MEELSSILNETHNIVKKAAVNSTQNYFGLFTEGILLVRKYWISTHFKDLILQVLVGTVGAFGNVSCIFSFSRKRNTRNFHHLMLATAVFDFLYILTAIMLFSLPRLAQR